MTGLNHSLILAQNAGGDPSGPMAIVILLIQLGILVLMIAGMWKTFEKAGKPGWAAIVPIYNLFVITDISGKPSWWALLLLVPCVNIVILFLISIEVAKKFGKSEIFGVGLALLAFVFYPILGFGDARYRNS